MLAYAALAVYFHKCYFHWLRSSRNLSNVILIPVLVLLVYLYWRTYRLIAAHPEVGAKMIGCCGMLVALVASMIPSFYSSDLFSYINIGWLQVKYGANPYCLLIAGVAGLDKDPMLTPVWTLVPCLYGFAFTHLSRLVCQLSDGQLQRAVLFFKALAFATWLVGSILVYNGAKKFEVRRPDLSLFLYLFSPLLLLHTLSGCHNDIFMVVPTMASFLSAASNFVFLAVPLLVVGISIKYAWILALPFLLLFVLRRFGWKAICMNAVLGIGVFVSLGWHYRSDWHSVRWHELLYTLTLPANSFIATIDNLLRCLPLSVFAGDVEQRNLVTSKIISSVKVALVLLLFYLGSSLFYNAWKKRELTLRTCVERSLLLVMVLVCFVGGKFYPWYVIMFFPMCLWLPETSMLRKIGITLSLTQLFAVTFIGHGHANNFVLLTAVPVLILLRKELPITFKMIGRRHTRV
jgi:hypothetical protein